MMNNGKFSRGFTLLEILIVVMIIGILSSLALPGYNRSVEKARATEAMNIIKSVNDAVYSYAAEQGKCPSSFDKVLVSIPGTKTSKTVVTGKYFKYTLNAATNAPIPGTSCGGVIAESLSGYSYKIWNPYAVIDSTSKKRTLACTSSTTSGQSICKTLGIYTTSLPAS